MGNRRGRKVWAFLALLAVLSAAGWGGVCLDSWRLGPEFAWAAPGCCDLPAELPGDADPDCRCCDATGAVPLPAPPAVPPATVGAVKLLDSSAVLPPGFPSRPGPIPIG
ncbi:MAG: hypothetical protein Kow0054_11370 [Deferrisoma sp.]